MTDTVKSTLTELEKQLHQHPTRQNRSRLAEILHPDFIEFGRSGRTHNFAETVAALQQEEEPFSVHSQDYKLRLIGERAAILTYKSARVDSNGSFQRHTLRMSLWVQESAGWQLLFHQGTPTDPFICDAP